MRLALAQINPTVGGIAGNAALIAEFIAFARDGGADLVVFPELCLCGYPPKDLLLQEGFVPECAAAAKSLGEARTAGITAIFGTPLPLDPTPGATANSLLVYRDNEYIDYYDKRLLPTYDVFDEDRYFTPGNRAVVIEIAGVKVGLAICEDLWKGEDAGFRTRYDDAPDPVADLAAAGAELLIVPSASPFVLGKGARHRDILIRHARRHRLTVATVNQVGANDELIFDGHGAVYSPDGELVGAAPGFEEHLLVLDVPGPETVQKADRETGRAIGAREHGPLEDPRISAPAEQLLFRALTLGIHDYLRKTGFSTAIVGLSGGIDSALTAALAVAALGCENVTGVAMPGPFSSEHSVADAVELAERLGIRCLRMPIAEPFAGSKAVLDPAFADAGHAPIGRRRPDLTEENLQSRLRGTLLMALSNRSGAVVLNTGNKSEFAVGYCTLYGDMNGALAVLCDVPKQQVYRLSRWINENHAPCGFARPPIPESTIAKPPSAELAPGQKDQDSLPPYEVLDEVIERYVQGRQSPARIAAETGFDRAVVFRIARMIDTTEYKRKQAAIGLKVTSVAFGSGRRMPIAQAWRPDGA